MKKKQAFDVIFEKDDKIYGYMLAESNNKKMWRVADLTLLPPSMLTGEASFSSISPERQIITQQSDWRGGLQDLMYDDETKYYRSINTDARFKGQVILSGKNTDTDVASNLYRKIPNSHFEDWDDANTPTGWTTGGTVAQATGDDAYDGDYAVKMQNTGGNGTDGSIYRDLAFTDTNQSQQFTITARCKVTADSGLSKIGIEDKDGNTTWSDDITNTSFALITKVVTLAADATRLRVKAYSDMTGDNYLHVDDIKVSTDSGTLAKCTAMAEFEGAIFYAYGDLLFKHDSDSLGVIMEFPAAITDLCVFQNPSATGGSNPTYQRLYIAQGTSAKFWYTDDAATFTISTVANTKYMANIGNGVFVINESTNTVVSSVNPINSGTAFSTTYKVSGDYYEITGLVDHPDIWFVRKEDQVYYLSGASVIPVIEGLDIEKNKDIDYPVYYWLDKLYIPSGKNALYEYDITDGTTTVLSPVKFAVGDTRYDGKITALASDGLEYLYIAVETASRCMVLAGRWETISGATDWRWHPIYDGSDSTEEISTMIVSNSLGKLLHIGNYAIATPVDPTGHNDPEDPDEWGSPEKAYDNDVISHAIDLVDQYNWGTYIEYTIASFSCSGILYYGSDYYNRWGAEIDIDAYYSAGWHDVYQGAYEADGWHRHTLASAQDVTKARVRIYNASVASVRLYEIKFGGSPAYYLKDIKLPVSYADPTSETTYEFESPGSFYTPWYRTTFSSLDKYFQELQVTSKCRDECAIAVYYQLKGAGDPTDADNWTLLGRCTQNDVITGSYPDEYLDTFPIKEASERIRFKFTLSSTDDDYSPILYGEGGGIQLTSNLVVGMAGRRQIEMVLRIGEKVVNHAGVPTHIGVSQQLINLELLDASAEPVTLTGIDAVKRTVLLRPTGLSEEVYLDEKTRQPEWRVRVTATEVA